MEAKISFAKKIGNFISNILLGDTKEIIIRMDERLFAVSQRVENIENEIKNEIRPDLKNLRERFVVLENRFVDFKERITVVEDQVRTTWRDKIAPSRSPRKLNEKGNNILFKSGIKEIIDAKQNELFAVVRSKHAKNPYDAEEYVLQAVADLKKDSILVENLKTGAYSVGADIDTVFLVGGIYLRDLIFPRLGFSVDQIDLHDAVHVYQ